MLLTIHAALSMLMAYATYVAADMAVNYELAFPAFRLCIVHQNDLHGHFGPVRPSGNPCSDRDLRRDNCYGSFARAVKYAKYSLLFNKNVLKVNSGDFYQGSMFYSVFKSRFIIDMVRWMNYDALVLGNSDFADGLSGLLPFMREIHGFVCTNINFDGLKNLTLRDEVKTLCPEFIIYNFTSEENALHPAKLHRVGVVGYTTPDTDQIWHVEDIQFEDEVVALTRVINHLHDEHNVKIIVALGHSGYDKDIEIARKVAHLDVIIGGHSHTLTWPNIRNPFEAGPPPHDEDQSSARGPYPTVVTQTSGRTVLVTNLFKNGKYISDLVMHFNSDGEVIRHWGFPTMLSSEFEEDHDTKKEFERYSALMVTESKRVIGTSLVDLVGRNEVCHNVECTMGNMFTDAIIWMLRQYSKVDDQVRTVLALINGGSMKHDIPAGTVTLKQILKAMPYQNTIDLLTITGATLLKTLEHGVARLDEVHGSFMQMSGLRVAYNMSKPVGSRVYSVLVASNDSQISEYKPLVKNKVYSVAVTTFMSMAGDGFVMLRNERLTLMTRHELDLDIIVDYFKQMSPYYTRQEGRIQFVSEHTGPSGGAAAGYRRRLRLLYMLPSTLLLLLHGLPVW